MTGNCKLCGAERELQKSHLLPASLYKRISNRLAINPNPILISPKISVQTSKQAADRLLCSACEQRFQRYGEKWVAENCYQGSSFPLRELLENSSPVESGSELAAFSADHVKGLNWKALVYFASSVFWRASVHTWSIQGQEAHIELGPKYTEEFRKFLLHKSEFPEHVALWVAVNRADQFGATMAFPKGRRKNGFHEHSFFIPGMGIWLFVGRLIPLEIRRVCIVNSPEHVIMSSELIDQRIGKAVAHIMKTSKPAKRFLR